MGRLMAIAGRKGAQDARRGKIFTKLIREISVAARQGGGRARVAQGVRAGVAAAARAGVSEGGAGARRRGRAGLSCLAAYFSWSAV